MNIKSAVKISHRNVRPVYLCILDGVAVGPKNRETNAVYSAIKNGKAPFLKNLFKNEKYSLLECSGPAIDFDKGTMGNSEVNHLNIGAGRVVPQSLTRINNAVKDGSFLSNEALLKAVSNCKENNSALHLMGILQGHGGTVHGNIEHLFGLLKLVKQNELKKVNIHLFTDGRDTDPNAAGQIYLKMLEDKISDLGLSSDVKIATVMGRSVAMDRDVAWNTILSAMKTIVFAQSECAALTARQAIEDSYSDGITDEFIRPVIIGDYKGIDPKDSIIFFNYRQDRARQLTAAFCETNMNFFNYKDGAKPIDENTYKQFLAMQSKMKDIVFVSMTEYYEGTNSLTAFPEPKIPKTVGEVVSNAGLKQLRLAGPEKFAHVTGWLSGREGASFPGEIRHLAHDQTLKDRTQSGNRYDFVPEMTAYLETGYALNAIKQNDYSLIVHNFQNGDMVGHTGNFKAAEEAIRHVSNCLGQLIPAFVSSGGIFIVTADHGNADEMMILSKDNTLKVSTQHSLQPVPFWVLGKNLDFTLKQSGVVSSIGATVLDVMGLPAPGVMTAESLIHRKKSQITI